MNSRRTFLAGLGAAALAPSALPNVAPAALGDGPLVPPTDGAYVVGVTSNPQLPGPAGELVLRSWLSVDADGPGVGIVSDRYGPGFGSHLDVQSATRTGNHVTWQGVVARSNEPLLVGTPFALTATVHGSEATLELALMGQTFRGKGVFTG